MDMLSSGQIVGKAHINRMEASALDGLMKAGVLNDPKDEAAGRRRHAAGILLREIFDTAEIESSSTGHYDKVTNEMLPGGAPHPKGNNALEHEVEYHRLMKLIFPFHTVVRNVCCHNEKPPLVVRNGLARPCNWDEALRKGLDRIADDKFADSRKRPRRVRMPEQLPA
ncbi:MAG: hypothetical protein K0S94_2809 [Nitrospira sp.]|nr:hypothetical protein [Nitrospira sp.]